MKILLITLITLNSILCFSQTENRIKKIEIYAKMIDYAYAGRDLVSKHNIKKESDIYVKINDELRIEMSKIQSYINSLLKAEEQLDYGDYDALVIIHYAHKKKERYYISSGYGGIYNNNIRYNYSCLFISAVYSFLPIYYYNYGQPYYYQKPCDEIAIGNN